MKNNNMTSFIIIAGIVIVVVFTGVLFTNLTPNNESDAYYIEVQDELEDKIESFNITDNQLSIITKIDNLEFCVKTTKSTPNANNLCWNKIENNNGSIKIMPHRTYYVWIKDEGGNISSYFTINSDNNNDDN